MTPEELIALRREACGPLNAANAAGSANPRQHSALKYALDPECLPDRIHEAIQSPPPDLNLSNQRGYYSLKSLSDFRKYYEEGDGNDFLQFSLGDYNRFVSQYWFGMTGAIGDFVHRECWILAAESHGQDSKLTKGMRFLLSELRPGFGDDELTAAVERLEQLPGYSKGQIAAAKQYPEDFKAVLNTLLTGQGEGWLARFVNHPLRREILEPQWGLYLNGNHRDVALCVYTTQGTVHISQNGQNLELRSNEEGRVIATVSHLLKAGIKPNEPIRISGQNCPALDTNTVSFARFRQNSTFCPFLKLDPNLQIQAARLWAFLPGGNWEFRLGDSVPPTPEKYVIRGLGDLHKLDFTSIDRAGPKMLKVNETGRIQIGAAPELAVTNADPWVQSLNEPKTHFVFGNQANLHLTDIDAPADQWTCSAGAAIVWNNGRPFLQCNGEYGRKITVSINVGRLYPIPLVVRFLPEEMREAMIKEQPRQQDGVSWSPLPNDHAEFAHAVSQAGLVRGQLACNGETVQVWVPSAHPHFWFRHGFHPVTQADQHAEFASIDELSQRHLHIYLPLGSHHILWGGEPWLECEGPGYWEESLSNLGTEWPMLQQSSKLELSGDGYEPIPLATTAAPQQPEAEAWHIGHEAINEPEFEQFLTGNIDLNELASRLKCLRFSDLPWPMSCSWSGPELRTRFDKLFSRCRQVKPQVTRQEIRDLIPALNDLWEISKGNRPECCWIPFNAFWLNNTDQAAEFHALVDIQPNGQNDRIAELAPQHLPQNRRTLQVRFSYAGATSFTRPNQQTARSWQFHIWNDGINTPAWLNVESHRDIPQQFPHTDPDLTSRMFKTVIAYSIRLIAAHADQRLAYALIEMSREFKRISSQRAICFQAAAMCRLHFRMQAHQENLDPNDDFLRLSHPRFTRWLHQLCKGICENEGARAIFHSDLVTVDWALAWFHEPI